ncbi:hypothetical protein ACIQW9_13515 [Herminiimonas sp. NPDC097707]|uniref:hypothetical protein n=1 Tax=Herminiimonas sp. NPDC097707 TaxID=3364007 RepID=UPI00383A827B
MQELDTDNKTPTEVQSPVQDGSPKFGRLLLLLACAVALIVAITLGSQAYYTP